MAIRKYKPWRDERERLHGAPALLSQKQLNALFAINQELKREHTKQRTYCKCHNLELTTEGTCPLG